MAPSPEGSHPRREGTGESWQPQTGPEATHTFGKREKSATPLRDVNRCSVRASDLIAHRGYTVLVTDTGGRIGGRIEGFYFHRTRFLSRLGFKVDGADPKLVSAGVEVLEDGGLHIRRLPRREAAMPPAEDRIAAAMRSALDAEDATPVAGAPRRDGAAV